MSITATIHIRHDRLALVPTLRRLDDVAIRVIPQGNTSPGSTMFPFLVEYTDRAKLEAAFDDDPTVESYSLVDWTDDQGIYYIEHAPETKLISTVVTEANGFLMHTETTDGGWFVRLLLPDRAALNDIWTYANQHDISFDIIEIYGNEDASGQSSYGLTDQQRSTLLLAFDRGYFRAPREASLDEIAHELDLSSTAVSGRLRRGIRNLIAATIAENRRRE
ncbi:helix-turn-helix domain-containing protein [Halomarina rubra]|uniref:Helix-turn-helix domain-containing protein n=1 Tax=Halomarina rubra TaxID=2071873 RepID=A0ABD6AX50_9EURY|nr:helix-turn-helix domain-containing protein [Halomarina rubra]